MIIPKLDRHYVSELDQFLGELLEVVPLSACQEAEMNKQRHIMQLRDGVRAQQEEV